MKKLVVITLLALSAALAPSPAAAQVASQKYGGCLDPASYGQLCVGPRTGVLITRYDFSGPLSGKFTGGFQPGAGYGVILQSSDPAKSWKTIELDAFVSALIGGSSSTTPNNVSLTGLFTVFNYISLGGGCQWTEQAVGSAKTDFYITGGLTLNPGGETVAEAHAKVVAKAEREKAERQSENEAVK